MTARRRAHQRMRVNPPDGWGSIFAPVPGRSAQTRCLLCGRTGYGPHGRITVGVGFDGKYRVLPAPWQVDCLIGHTERCEACRRPLVNIQALRAHQRCKLHHACCLDHTTVPEWKSPFRSLVGAVAE